MDARRHAAAVVWAAAGMLEAQRQYRRVKGFAQLDALARNLEAAVAAGRTAAPAAA